MAIPYTSTTIREQLRYLLNEPTTSYWTNTELDNYVVIGCREVSRSSLCVESTYGLSLQTGIMEYNTSSTAGNAPNTDETDVVFTTGPETATSDGSADWIADGFKAGMRVTISNTTNNNKDFTIRGVTTEDIMTFFETITARGSGNADFDVIYTWIADIVKIYACVYHTGDALTDDLSYRGLQKIHPRNLRRIPNLTDGPPFYWWWFGDKIGIYPEPTSSENKDCVLIYHSRVTEAIADIPDEYQPAVLYYAMSRARIKERSMGESQMWFSMYLNSMAYQRQTQYDRGADSKEMGHIPDRTVAVG